MSEGNKEKRIRAPYTVPCSWCGALRGQVCTNGNFHLTRWFDYAPPRPKPAAVDVGEQSQVEGFPVEISLGDGFPAQTEVQDPKGEV